MIIFDIDTWSKPQIYNKSVETLETTKWASSSIDLESKAIIVTNSIHHYQNGLEQRNKNTIERY